MRDLKFYLELSLLHESQSLNFYYNYVVIGVTAGHEYNGVLTLFKPLVKGIDVKYSVET